MPDDPVRAPGSNYRRCLRLRPAPPPSPRCPGLRPGEAPGWGPWPRRRRYALGSAAPGRALLTVAPPWPGGSGDGHVAGLSGGSAGGAATPAGAVSDLFTALGNSDVIGMLDSVAPGERDAISRAGGHLRTVQAPRHTLHRADLGDVTGLSAQYKGLPPAPTSWPRRGRRDGDGGASPARSTRPVAIGYVLQDLLGVALNGTPHTATSRPRARWCWAPRRLAAAGT